MTSHGIHDIGSGTAGHGKERTAAALSVGFAVGTLIRAARGEVPIETLTPGDLVMTLDAGAQPLRWIGSLTVAATAETAPILIRKGTLASTRDLRVSPQHRMLLYGWQAEMLFGEDEVLATARSLINDTTILRADAGEVVYLRILFDSHQIVWAEGALSESFHPGPEGLRGLDAATRRNVSALLPKVAVGGAHAFGPSARRYLADGEATVFAPYVGNDPIGDVGTA